MLDQRKIRRDSKDKMGRTFRESIMRNREEIQIGLMDLPVRRGGFDATSCNLRKWGPDVVVEDGPHQEVRWLLVEESRRRVQE